MKKRPKDSSSSRAVKGKSLSEADRSAPSIRRLAATVAHEINNPLTSILLAAEKLTKDESLREATLQEIQLIREAAFRIRNIVEKLEKVRAERAKEYLPGIQMLDVNGEL